MFLQKDPQNQRVHVADIFHLYNTCKAQGCALAELNGPWHLTFALRQLENLTCFIQIICWEP